MKSFNILGVHRKIQFLGAGFLKRGAWIVCRFKRGLGKKEWVFLRGELISQYVNGQHPIQYLQKR